MVKPAERSYLQTLRCKAEPERIWQALILPEALRLWHADAAVIDPRRGGCYSYRSRLFGQRDARIDVFEPGRRLRLVFLPNPRWPAAGRNAIIEDFLLDVRPTGTREAQGQLRLIGTGVPPAAEWNATLKRLQAGWAVAFSYLQRQLESGTIERLVS
jgi:uncharacterized protein YndB with AHSA1/START domain